MAYVSKLPRRIGYDDKVDFNKIVKEVATAMDREEKYYRENDAKFRAVRQKVATYEEFCDIVLASNLNPLEKKDYKPINSNTGMTPWNVTAEISKNDTSINDKTNTIRSTSDSTYMPSSCKEFTKYYTTLDSKTKYSYLLEIGGVNLLKLFPVEMTDGIFDDVIFILDAELQPEHFTNVLKILLEISGMKMFKLSLKLLDNTNRASLSSLFAKLSQSTDFEADLNVAKSTYFI